MASSEEEEKENYLRIESPDFSLELEGDPDFILHTYDTVREDILRRLIELIQNSDVDPSDPSARTIVTPAVGESEVKSRKPTIDELAQRARSGRLNEANPNAYVWVYVTHEIYNKVYVVDLDAWNESPLAEFLDGRRLRKMFVERDARDQVKSMIGTGKTLWSELTPKGREQLATNNK